MELIQNIWTRFGFRGNPFDTSALAAASESLLPIAQAIVGREMKSPESRALLGVLRSPGGGRVVVEGDIGVGKTTFVNYHRYPHRREGRQIFYRASEDVRIIRDLPADVQRKLPLEGGQGGRMKEA